MHLRSVLIFVLIVLPISVSAETFKEIADRAKPGILGVAVCDLSTGKIEGINTDRKFPLQSVFKIFLAAAILDQVDAGHLSLDKTITLTTGDLRDGVGPVDNSHGGTFSIRKLLRAAVIESDNSAADSLLPLVGGPAGLTAWLQQKHLEGIRIDRDERIMARDVDGIPANLTPGKNASAIRDQISAPAQHAAFAAALASEKDTATPEAAVHFLIALKEGKLLTPNSTNLLLGWMRETVTGPKRLKAGFPPHTILAHKTGTGAVRGDIALATNDIGLATLPDGRTLAIAVFLTASPVPEASREDLLAACAKAAAMMSKK